MNNQKGYVVLIVTFFIMIIMLSVALTMSSQIAFEQKTATSAVKSTQAYYAAESGIEDALLILRRNPTLSSASYTLNVNGATATVAIPIIIGGTRAITSQGNNKSMVRSIQTVYVMDSQGVTFYYGVQAGDGGVVMNNGSRVMGNVFSDGDITGSGTIDNNVVISGNFRKIQGVNVGGNVLAYSCLSPTVVTGTLTYVTGGTHTCTVNGGTPTSQDSAIAQQPLPIPDQQITDWKNQFTPAQTIAGDVTLLNNETRSMGPVKIAGSLILGNKSTLILTGTIYVQGNITFGTNDVIKLDSFYGPLGGVLIADGTITTKTDSMFSGSGQEGSYLLLLSTSISDSAISLKNNSAGAAFYASAGGIDIPNNVSVLEATGKKLTLGNGAEIQSSYGTVNIFFSSGPAGGWKVVSWTEE